MGQQRFFFFSSFVFLCFALMFNTKALAAYYYDYADLPGQNPESRFYIEGQLGEGFKHVSSFNRSFSGTFLNGDGTSFNVVANANVNNSKTRKIAGRLAFGYQMNPYFAFEFGGDVWSKSDITGNAILIVNSATFSFYGTATRQNYAIDLLADLKLPIQQGFYVFAKGGIAYAVDSITNTKATASIVSPPVLEVAAFLKNRFNSTIHAYNPELVAGIGYQSSPRWGFTLNYFRIFGNNNQSSNRNNFYHKVPSLGMATFGVQWSTKA